MSTAISKKLILVLSAITIVVGSGAVGATYVNAQSLQDQINELQQQNANNQSAVDRLKEQAVSYQDAIEKLQAQIGSLQAQIDKNTELQNQLKEEIKQAEAELEKQKELLAKNIRAMYVEGDISTIEMLASSNDLSEFIDKQQYRDSIKNEISTTVTKINELKLKLKGQKEKVDALIKDQQNQRADLAESRSEQNELLSYNQSQQADFNQKSKANEARIAELRRLQAIENARIFGGTPGVGPACGGGYPGSAPGPWGPWGCNYPLDYSIDSWGMYNRECVSYTAYKVAASGRYMPYWGGRGNANQWDDNARAAGYQVDYDPQPGDVAVSNAGYYGHTMYVEAVYGDGRILISQYNGAWTGTYSEAVINKGSLVFITFP